MRTLVTAVLVAREGGEWLAQTLAALAGQTRTPDRLIAVSNGSPEQVAQQLAAGGAERVVTTTGALPFGEAVSRAETVIPSTGTESPAEEWLWLLTEDSAPEPEALERILLTVQRSPSVAIAGPKLVDWDRPERIIELGQSLTHRGERWMLRRQELDQQQYDHLQDALGVGPVGMLVRRDVWQQLGGFDPALPVFDDGLDFSVRARLSGYRVVVAPDSRVRFAQRGIAGPRIDRSRRVLRIAHRQGRSAQLHRRIAYAPAFLSFFMWLGLPLLAVGRVCWALIREHPGRMLGEFTSAMGVFFRPGAILASRRRIRRLSGPGWSAVKPLRVDPKTVRTARMIDREAILAAQGRQVRELHFISSGGLAVLVVALVAAAALCWWALAHTSLSGGALAPLSPIGELWQNTRTQDGVPADPFTWVLAVLGSLTFWNPSHAIVLLFVAAIPLSALGGWIWAAQLTESRAGRALVGLGWALSPVLLGSLAAGRVPTLILAIALPWLLLAASRCRESWSWSGTASLLTAVVLACAPVLIPVAIVFLLVGLFSSVRGITRVLSIAIAPLALFAPKLIALVGGSPLNLLLDPGITPGYTAATPRQLLLGFPEFGLEGWGAIFETLGLGEVPVTVLVGVLFLLIALLAILGLLTARVQVTLLLAALGGLGLLTAVLAPQLRLISQGSETVGLWTGSGLALYWISVLGLAAVGCTVLRRAAGPIVAVALVLALVAVSPLGFRLITAQTGLVAGEAQLPAIVQAAGAADPELRTLVLTAEQGPTVRAEMISGSGPRLDDIRTETRARGLGEQDHTVAQLVGALASTGLSSDLGAELTGEGIGFVLLAPNGDEVERALLQASLDQHTALSSAGQTDHGLLWRVQDAGAPSGVTAADADETVTQLGGVSITARVLWWIQLIVLLGMVLLALPTGEVVERPARRRRAQPAKITVAADPGSPAASIAPAALSDPAVASDPAAPADPAASADPAAETDSRTDEGGER
ncbi:MAG: glycosyltransferase [Leucobacter sp.]